MIEIQSRTEKALTREEKLRGDVIRVNEIFYSIQGESSHAGERCIFIRLTGCGLRCNYCDTEYAFYEGEDKTLDEVLSSIRQYDCRLVELTGGEPLEQEGVFELIEQLISSGYEVMVETGGHVSIARVNDKAKRILDLKTPSSGMEKRNLYSNLNLVTKNDEIKFVIGSREDYDWSKGKLLDYHLADKVGCVLFSPVKGEQREEALAQWILEDNLPVRFQVQLHKIIWPEILRGV